MNFFTKYIIRVLGSSCAKQHATMVKSPMRQQDDDPWKTNRITCATTKNYGEDLTFQP